MSLYDLTQREAWVGLFGVDPFDPGMVQTQEEQPIVEKKEEPGINPKDAIAGKKVNLSLVPPAALIYMAQAFEDGAVKYGPYNWRKNKVLARVYLAAILRHTMEYLDGEDSTRDTSLPHIGHILACAAILADAKETGNLIDDRPPKGAASDIIERIKKP